MHNVKSESIIKRIALPRDTLSDDSCVWSRRGFPGGAAPLSPTRPQGVVCTAPPCVWYTEAAWPSAFRRRIALKALENCFDLVDGEAFVALLHKPRSGYEQRAGLQGTSVSIADAVHVDSFGRGGARPWWFASLMSSAWTSFCSSCRPRSPTEKLAPVFVVDCAVRVRVCSCR